MYYFPSLNFAPSEPPSQLTLLAHPGDPFPRSIPVPTPAYHTHPLIPELQHRRITLLSTLSDTPILDSPGKYYELWRAQIEDTDKRGARKQEIVVVKIVQGVSWVISSLEHEFRVYEDTGMKKLQGDVIPRCYGFYKGLGIALLVLEHIDSVGFGQLEKVNSDVDIEGLTMRAMCKIHLAGYEHTDVMAFDPATNEPDHILLQQKYTNIKGSLVQQYAIRVVSFRRAVKHTCPMQISYPMETQKGPKSLVGQCHELVNIERKVLRA